MSNEQVWLDRFQQQSSQREGDHRTPFQRDKARILHSAAFRRLQAKTQVLGVGMSDFYRTRLTHSLEASQIGQGIAAQLRSKFPDLTSDLGLNDTLIEALCLSHDIGHPPFGHGGEVALHYKMRHHGGFEGNGQTFRIVTKLEPYTADAGMNLSRRTLLGLVKYPNYIDALENQSLVDKDSSLTHRQIQAGKWHPPKGLYLCDSPLFDWVTEPLNVADTTRFMSFTPSAKYHSKTRYKSFDCSIMELADDIAYGIHDLEDAIVMGIVSQSEFMQEVAEPISKIGNIWLSTNMLAIASKLFSHQHHERKDAIGALVNSFITGIEIQDIEPAFAEPLLKYNAIFPEQYHQALSLFKKYVFNRVILKPDIQLLEYKGQQIVMELFEAFSSDPLRLLPDNTRQRYIKACEQNNGQRVIADYISGMTDDFASRLYSNLFLPSSQTGIDKSVI